MEKEPTNLQAHSLGTLIDKGVARGTSETCDLFTLALMTLEEGYIGMALAGGAAALGTLIIAGLVRKSRK
jgi:fission 1 protein